MNKTYWWGGSLALTCLLAAAGTFSTRALHNSLVASVSGRTARSVGLPPTVVVRTLVGQPPGPEWLDGPARTATFQRMRDLAVDGAGNVYVADGQVVRKITPAGLVSTLAGEPPAQTVLRDGNPTRVTVSTFDALDGRGSAARFSRLGGIAVTPGGTVYVADEGAQTIRRVSPLGEVTTLAGRNNQEGHADGPGAQASFNGPGGLAMDARGNVLVADRLNHTIRKITPAGQVSTLAGQAGEQGYADGPGAWARFYQPTAVAFAPDGTLYVHDGGNNTIRRVSPLGVVTTWGGHPTNVRPAPGPGAALEFDYHQGLALDRAGSLYLIQDRNAIRRLRLLDGAELPTAGTPDGRDHVDALTPAAARFNFPSAVATGPDGSLYVADQGNGVVRRISPQGVVSTLAGYNSDPRFNPARAREALGSSLGLAFGPQGNLYLADGDHALIRCVSPAGVMRPYAGLHGACGFDDGPANQARFSAPTAVAAGPDGTLYVTDSPSHTIRKISPQGVVSTLAGLPTQAGNRDGAPDQALFNDPQGVAVAPDGMVYVTDRRTGAVRRVSPAGRVSTFVKGYYQPPVEPLSDAPRLVPEASAVAVGPDGAVYVFKGALYRYSPAGQAQLLAGDPTAESGYADGPGAQARFNAPTGLAVDAQGIVYVADTGNHLIRRVSPTGEVSTLAGDAHYDQTESGYGPDGSAMDSYYGGYADGPGPQARFSHPSALALGPDGTLYVADTGNQCVRVIRAVR